MTNFVKYKNVELCTNDTDDGLFIWAKQPHQLSPQWCQLLGTCQFSVKGLKNKEAKIKKYTKENLYDENGELTLPHELRNVVRS